MARRAICKRDIEANDGTVIKKGEVVQVTFGLFYDPNLGVVSRIQAGRRFICSVNVKDLDFKSI